MGTGPEKPVAPSAHAAMSAFRAKEILPLCGRLAAGCGVGPQIADSTGTTVPVCDLIMAHAGEARSRVW
jgi:hypothetical protein